ncbi:hypothetical protein D9756_001138 [Leucocoprinus leucothites]|uniref:F-box domain-containing protein n=1 Tax=Leucocoprinus leucothites TaxID=201217 RepID=A0A8H5GG39_9AGAR|nr:hypothetical protein D9756_001138 [Leucoagaricus leucothites]
MTTDPEPTIRRNTLIHAFPTEMLANIFHIYFWEQELSGEGDCLSLHNARVTFRLVCRRWNWIIQSTPQLWTFVVVDYDLCLKEPPSPPVAYYEDWIQRSKTLPITLHISPVDGYCPKCEEGSEHFAEILETLWTSVSRWKRLTIGYICDLPIDMISDRDFSGANQLTHLSIDIPSLDPETMDDTVEYFVQALANIPCLRSLAWNSFSGVMAVTMVKYMPCNDLTELFLEFDESLSLKPALDLIRGIPSLISLTLAGELLDYNDDAEFDGDEPPQMLVHLPHLRFLDISFKGSFCEDFLPLMDCPNLISFTISPNHGLYSELLSKVVEFVGRHTALKKLQMGKFPKHEIVPFFHTDMFQLNQVPVVIVHIYDKHRSYGEEPVTVEGFIDIMDSAKVEMRDV